jgi:hypothetical protein
MQSKATSVEQYLSELPEDRRAALRAIREVILKHLPTGYAEGMQYGMIGYFVPHSRYPAGYHCDPRQPLPFGGLASQKNHMAVYLMGLYGDSASEKSFRAAWAKTGKKLDMGKCCIRFKRLEDLPLDLLGNTIASMSVDKYIAAYEASIAARSGKSASKSQANSTSERSRKSITPKASAKRPAVKEPAAAPVHSKKSAPKKLSPTKAATRKTATKKAAPKKAPATNFAPQNPRSK